MAAWSLDTMVLSADRIATVQRDIDKYNEGKSLVDKLAEWKIPSGGKWFSAGEVKLGQLIIDKVKITKRRTRQRNKL